MQWCVHGGQAEVDGTQSIPVEHGPTYRGRIRFRCSGISLYEVRDFHELLLVVRERRFRWYVSPQVVNS